MTMADTVAVMNAGRIEQIGPPDELYDLPATAFVANFLGKSNLFEATVTESNGDWLSLSFAGTTTGLAASRAVQTTGTIVAGIRPEKIIAAPAGQPPASAGSGWAKVPGGRVTSVSYTGVSTEYEIAVQGLGEFTVFAQNLHSTGFTEGDQVDLWWEESNLFGLAGDADTEAGIEEV